MLHFSLAQLGISKLSPFQQGGVRGLCSEQISPAVGTVSLTSCKQRNRLCCASQVMNSSSHYRKSLERERNLLMTKADNYGKSFIKNGPSGQDGISAAA